MAFSCTVCIEAALKKLAQQEEKYTTELNDALRQYAKLKEQAAEFDPDELQDARLALRPVMERSAVDRVQSAYVNTYDPLIMYDSKRDAVVLLNEQEEKKSVREFCTKTNKSRLNKGVARRKTEAIGSDDTVGRPFAYTYWVQRVSLERRSFRNSCAVQNVKIPGRFLFKRQKIIYILLKIWESDMMKSEFVVKRKMRYRKESYPHQERGDLCLYIWRQMIERVEVCGMKHEEYLALCEEINAIDRQYHYSF